MSEMPYWKWLIWTASQITAAGFDPKDRFETIGHRRPLSTRWALTIGMWGVQTPTEIMTTVGITPGTADRGVFDVFKHRHRLFSGPQLLRELPFMPKKEERGYMKGRDWGQYDLGVQIHALARVRMHETSLGFQGDVIETMRLQFHILPVEAYLYYNAVEAIIDDCGLRLEQWLTLDSQVRRRLWDTAFDGSPMVIECPEEIRLIEKARHDPEVL